MADVGDPSTIQTKLVPTWLPDGRNVTGAVVGLLPRVIDLRPYGKPLLLSSAHRLLGKGRQTILIAPNGQPALTVHCYQGHKYVKDVEIADLDIWCPQGQDAVAVDATVGTINDLRIHNVYVNGGRINMPGEHYFCKFNSVRFVEPRTQCLRLDGQAHALYGVDLSGQFWGTLPRPEAMFETHGSLTIDGFTHVEGDFGCRLMDHYDWQGWQGAVYANSLWAEQHAAGIATGKLSGVRFCGPTLPGNWPGNEWIIENSNILTADRTVSSQKMQTMPRGFIHSRLQELEQAALEKERKLRKAA